MPSHRSPVWNRSRQLDNRWWLTALLLIGALPVAGTGCSSVPEAPIQGKGTLWGSFTLAPPDGYTPPGAGGGSYGDPRLRGVVSVDYEKPGFSVVYLEDRQPPVSRCALTIRETPTGPRIEPSHGAFAAGGTIDIVNHSGAKQIISIPELGELRPLDPGARWERSVEASGELSLHLLGKSPAHAQLFVSPGPFSICAPDGRWTLANQEPGPARLRSWNVRYPPAMRDVEILPGSVLEIPLRATTAPIENAMR